AGYRPRRRLSRRLWPCPASGTAGATTGCAPVGRSRATHRTGCRTGGSGRCPRRTPRRSGPPGAVSYSGAPSTRRAAAWRPVAVPPVAAPRNPPVARWGRATARRFAAVRVVRRRRVRRARPWRRPSREPRRAAGPAVAEVGAAEEAVPRPEAGEAVVVGAAGAAAPRLEATPAARPEAAAEGVEAVVV